MRNDRLTGKKSRLLSGTILVFSILMCSCLLPYTFTVTESDGIPPTLGPYPESRFMSVDGIWIHYRILFPTETEPRGKILLVHGLGGSTYSFDKMIGPLVEEGYVVVAADLPGFGYSDRPEKFDHSQVNRAKLLWSLLANLDHGLDTPYLSETPWHLVGHSMGGGTVTAMAVADPDRSASLTLIAGALEDTRNVFMTLMDFPPYARWTRIFLERSLLTESRVGKILGDAYGRTPTEGEVAAYVSPLQLPGTARGLTGFTKTSKSIPLTDVGILGLPVSAIWGEYDTIVPLDRSRTIGRFLPQMRLYVIEDSAHIPMETHPEKTNFALIEFLSENQI